MSFFAKFKMRVTSQGESPVSRQVFGFFYFVLLFLKIKIVPCTCKILNEIIFVTFVTNTKKSF